MTRGNVKSLGDAIETVLRVYGLENGIRQYDAMRQWNEIVGEEISKVSSALDVNDNILYVKVKSMTWRTELQFQKMQILAKIENRFGKNVIKDIRFY